MTADSSAHRGGSLTFLPSSPNTEPVLCSDWGRPRCNQGVRPGQSHISFQGSGTPLWHCWWPRTLWSGRVHQNRRSKSPRSLPTKTWSTSHGQSGCTSCPSPTQQTPGLRWRRTAPWGEKMLLMSGPNPLSHRIKLVHRHHVWLHEK